MLNIQKPIAGQSIKASWGQQVVDSLNYIMPIGSTGIAVDTNSAGSMIQMRENNVTKSVDAIPAVSLSGHPVSKSLSVDRLGNYSLYGFDGPLSVASSIYVTSADTSCMSAYSVLVRNYNGTDGNLSNVPTLEYYPLSAIGTVPPDGVVKDWTYSMGYHYGAEHIYDENPPLSARELEVWNFHDHRQDEPSVYFPKNNELSINWLNCNCQVLIRTHEHKKYYGEVSGIGYEDTTPKPAMVYAPLSDFVVCCDSQLGTFEDGNGKSLAWTKVPGTEIPEIELYGFANSEYVPLDLSHQDEAVGFPNNGVLVCRQINNSTSPDSPEVRYAQLSQFWMFPDSQVENGWHGKSVEAEYMTIGRKIELGLYGFDQNNEYEVSPYQLFSDEYQFLLRAKDHQNIPELQYITMNSFVNEMCTLISSNICSWTSGIWESGDSYLSMVLCGNMLIPDADSGSNQSWSTQKFDDREYGNYDCHEFGLYKFRDDERISPDEAVLKDLDIVVRENTNTSLNYVSLSGILNPKEVLVDSQLQSSYSIEWGWDSVSGDYLKLMDFDNPNSSWDMIDIVEAYDCQFICRQEFDGAKNLIYYNLNSLITIPDSRAGSPRSSYDSPSKTIDYYYDSNNRPVFCLYGANDIYNKDRPFDEYNLTCYCMPILNRYTGELDWGKAETIATAIFDYGAREMVSAIVEEMISSVKNTGFTGDKTRVETLSTIQGSLYQGKVFDTYENGRLLSSSQIMWVPV